MCLVQHPATVVVGVGGGEKGVAIAGLLFAKDTTEHVRSPPDPGGGGGVGAVEYFGPPGAVGVHSVGVKARGGAGAGDGADAARRVRDGDLSRAGGLGDGGRALVRRIGVGGRVAECVGPRDNTPESVVGSAEHGRAGHSCAALRDAVRRPGRDAAAEGVVGDVRLDRDGVEDGADDDASGGVVGEGGAGAVGRGLGGLAAAGAGPGGDGGQTVEGGALRLAAVDIVFVGDAVDLLPDVGGGHQLGALFDQVACTTVYGDTAGGLHGDGIGLEFMDAGDGLGPDGIDPGVGVEVELAVFVADGGDAPGGVVVEVGGVPGGDGPKIPGGAVGGFRDGCTLDDVLIVGGVCVVCAFDFDTADFADDGAGPDVV